MSQLPLNPTAYGGEHLKTRAGRSRPRPLSVINSMHVVMRSTQAVGRWSFRYRGNDKKIKLILARFAKRYHVEIFSYANSSNHVHLHIRLNQHAGYAPFIKAVSGVIAMAITGAGPGRPLKKKFWDRRPFTRIAQGLRQAMRVQDYIWINILEGMRCSRELAREQVFRGG